MSDERDLLVAFEGFYEAVCRDRDPQAALALWADDDDVTLFGSDEVDAALGPVELGRHLEAIAAYPAEIVFAWGERRARIEAEVAWVAAQGTLSVGGDAVPYEAAGVFVRRQGRWLWHTHAGSTPTPQAS